MALEVQPEARRGVGFAWDRGSKEGRGSVREVSGKMVIYKRTLGE